LRRALAAFRSPDLSEDEGLRWLWLACRIARALWDEETWEALVTRFVQLARETGALSVLPLALSVRTVAHVFAGELDAAAALGEELRGVTEATGSPFVPYGALMVAAWRGRDEEATDLIAAILEEAVSRGEVLGLTVTGLATAVLNNGFGRYENAMAAAERAGEHPEELNASRVWALVELVEAATRLGTPERADGPLQRITESTRASGTEWALGIEARCRALMSGGYVAERAYREAIERLGRTRIRGELARAHLLYGEWLRREGRRSDAREKLRTAYEMFTAMGMEAFAGRAERELGATGETVRKRPAEAGSEMTAQEAQVARLVRGGPHQSRDRSPVVHQSAHGRVSPAQDFRQAQHHLTQAAPPLIRSRPPRRRPARSRGLDAVVRLDLEIPLPGSTITIRHRFIRDRWSRS
jgi:tetratricopeptide (TPR) repeat protein